MSTRTYKQERLDLESLDRRASVDLAAPRPIRFHFRPTLVFLAPHFHLQIMMAVCQSDAAWFAVAPQFNGFHLAAHTEHDGLVSSVQL